MADEPQQTEMSYDDDLAADVKSAMTEVNAKEPAAEPSSAPEPAPAEAAPVEAKTTDGRPRDQQGRFTEKPADDKPKETIQQAVDAAATSGKDQRVAPKVPDAKPMAGPPSTWSPKAKQLWDRLPDVVRNDILAQADPAVGNLKPFADRARAQGQSLDQVLNSYVGIEELIRSNPMQGFTRVAQNLGLTQHQMGQFFGQLAQAHGYAPQNQANGQYLSPPVDPNAAPQAAEPDLSQLLAPVMSPLAQRLDQLEQRYMHQAEAERGQRLTSATSVIEKFRTNPANRYYDNVEPLVGDLLEKGLVPRTGDFNADLAAAYEKACRLDPEVNEILTNERLESLQAEKDKAAREAAEKARSASRSVTGSPSSGASNPAQKRDPRMSYDDDLHNDVVAAMRESMGRA